MLNVARGASLFTRSIASKIVVPYLIVIFLLAMLLTYVMTNLIVGSLEERFRQELASGGRAANEAMVVLETDQLNLLRQMSFTVGVDEALVARDTDALLRLLGPIAATSEIAYVDVFAADGRQLVALRSPRLGTEAAGRVDASARVWAPVAKVLGGTRDPLGDKFTSVVAAPWGPLLVTAGPVERDGTLVGAISIAMPMDEVTARLSREAGMKGITLYAPDGTLMSTTLRSSSQTLVQALGVDASARQAVVTGDQIVLRRATIEGLPYVEMLGPLAVRQELALLIGVGNLVTVIEDSGANTRNTLVVIFSVMIVAVLGIGLWRAHTITSPLRSLVSATARVRRNDLEFELPVRSRDETGELTAGFNEMTGGLRERERSRVAIERYMSPKVYRLIQSGELTMGGTRREITVLKTDIRGFTTRAEMMDPEALVEFLNRYFERMVAKVTKYDGEVDKYMGDSILAKFGATEWYPDHAQRAVLAMVEMVEACEELNEELAADGLAPIHMGIGANSGAAVVGNLGSTERMEYTVISDAVNTAQRIEELCKEFGWDLLISATTYSEAKDVVDVGLPWEIQLRGQSRSTLVYPVLGRKGEVSPRRDRAYLKLQYRRGASAQDLVPAVSKN